MKFQGFGTGGAWWQTRAMGLAVLGAVLVVAAGTVVASKGGSGAQTQAQVAPTLAQQVAAASPSTPIPASPTQAPPNRANCDQIRGTPYQSDVEQAWFQQNCAVSTPTKTATGATSTQNAASPAPPPPPPAPAHTGPSIPGGGSVSGDEMVITRLGIDGYISSSYVDPGNGQMGDPGGPYDILWYDFSGFDGLGGAPGAGGNAVFAGHVDYHPHIEAIFWTLRQAAAGDIIDYYKANGQHLQYQVQWNIDAQPDADFTDYVAQTGQDIMTIITCDGVFNPDTRHYDHRSVVRAVRIS
ncbi:MAG TPA: class F sortase [Dehalococcoidia bacterium]|jgi:LPXTG-site transpeptidase (sortase) family protein